MKTCFLSAVFLILGVKMKWNEITFLMNGTDKGYQLIQKCDAPRDDDIKKAIDKLREGDLLLRKINGLLFTFYHVGLYVGKLVIEFSGNINH